MPPKTNPPQPVGRCLGAAVGTQNKNGRSKPLPYIFLISHSSFHYSSFIIHHSLCPSPLSYKISRSQSEHFTHRRWISSAKSGFHPTPSDFIAPSALRCRRFSPDVLSPKFEKKPKPQIIRSEKSQNGEIFALKKAKTPIYSL